MTCPLKQFLSGIQLISFASLVIFKHIRLHQQPDPVTHNKPLFHCQTNIAVIQPALSQH